ncbi:hypothetical protein [Bosea sp. BK604]|uniref:hypothetical protein n=1 Tax=Bosea sp. BK604 TaxID=2512180 RepID=UPI001042DCE3|nr:hypothetical protein [Bosea sp. BK604]TCR66516.1 hypothetical protein EV560_104396 [Bosea sp. BK604]
MTSHAPVPRVKLAGLERTARLAGEAFAHEDLAVLPPRFGMSQSRRLWWLVAAIALAGLVALALR